MRPETLTPLRTKLRPRNDTDILLAWISRGSRERINCSARRMNQIVVAVNAAANSNAPSFSQNRGRRHRRGI